MFLSLSTDTPYLEYVSVFTVLVAALHAYLDLRQLRALKNTTIPKPVR